ncbi:galactosylceramide sulfotransferase-like [Centroberyx affinis]|uniref:galactosylceramide sulfotransferase-like n=1 Tax=Centroberyx affinis TaxID=166261 RepID=UPI003A5B9509
MYMKGNEMRYSGPGSASGKKLFLSLVVLALMLRNLLPEGRGADSPLAGWAESLVMQEAFFLHLLLCLRRVLCSPRRSLWMLLMLLTVICVAIQILGVVRQARNDKLTGLLKLRFTAENQHPLPSVQYVWENLHAEPALVDKEGTAERPCQNEVERRGERFEGYLKPSDEILSRHVDKTSKFINSQTEARKVSTGKLILPKDPTLRNKQSLGLSGSLVLQQGVPSHSSSDSRSHHIPHFHSNSKDLTSAIDQRILNTPTPSSSSKAHLNNIHNSKGSCQPKDHIVFLKTHKTASSTILNILYRYGDSRNLTFALPLSKHSQLFYPFFFASHFVEGVSSRSVRQFHIMCNHMRFRKSEVAKVMPEDTFYFSILRHPVAMMESIFIYYKSIPAFHKARSLDDFLDNGWRGYNSSLTNNHYAHNILAFDFGFNNNVSVDAEDLEARASTAIAAIEQDFHLILISEYFDESMVLLKHALCWSLDDVVSFKLNSRSERTRHPLLPNTADKIKAWNALDWRLYLHFNATFWHKVDTLVGQEEMRREVSQLKELRAQLTKTCLKDGGAVDPSQIKDAGLKPFQYGAAVIQGYNLNPGLEGSTKTKCQNLITPELQYTDTLYSQQFPELAAKQRKAARMVAPQRQSGSNRTGMTRQVWAREAHHRRTVRHKDPNTKNQKAPTRLERMSKANGSSAKENRNGEIGPPWLIPLYR